MVAGERLSRVFAVLPDLNPVSDSKQLLVASVAIRFALVLLESSFTKWRDTEGTNEVLWVKLVPHSCYNPSRNGFVAGSTQGAPVLVVVQFTVGFTFVFVVSSSSKPVLAFVANKALNVPLPLECCYHIVHNGLVAAATLWSEHLIIISLTIRFTFKHVVLSATPGKGFLAVYTDKAVRVPRLLKSRDTSINNRPVTVRAARSKLCMVILLTVGHVISFKELPHSQLNSTSDTHKVLGMPGFSQRSDHLSDNDFIASRAHPTIINPDSFFGQIRVKRSHHAVEIIIPLGLVGMSVS